MVVQQGRGVAVGFGFLKQQAEAGEEVFSALIVKKDGAFFNTSYNDVLQQTGNVDACVSWHGDRVARILNISRISPLVSLWAECQGESQRIELLQ